MKVLFLASTFFVLSVSANVTISDVYTTNTSSPDEISANGNYVVKEFRTQNTSTSSVSQNGAVSSFSNHFQWAMAHRVNQPEAPNFALIYLRQVNYEISFTVNDPLNLGYIIDVNQVVKGIVSANREEPIQVGMSAGILLGRIDDGSGPVLKTNLAVFGGGVNISGTDLVTYKEKVNFRESDYQTASYSGTRTFKISFASKPSPAGTSVFQNYGGGETSLRYGLETIHQSNGDTSRPDFQFTGYSGLGAEIPSDLGHKVNIRVTALQTILDSDQDGIADENDNCPLTFNPDQSDVDGDGVGDVCDNCVETPNSDQLDSNGNGIGDACDYIDVSYAIFPKKIKCDSNGKLPMGVFSTQDFDATQIDLNTLLFQDIPVTQDNNKLKTEDLDADGDQDLILHFNRSDICYALEAEPTKTDVEVMLEGETTSGDKFRGTTIIQILKK